MMPMPLARTYSDEDEEENVNETPTDDEPRLEFTTATREISNNNGNNNQNHTNNSSSNLNSNHAGHGGHRIFFQSISNFISIASIEPLLFLFRFAMCICDVTIQTFYLETICNKEYWNNSDVNCLNLTEFEKTHVEKISAQYFNYRQLLEYGPSIIFVLIMGQYVDKNGSKFPMLFTILCSAISSSIYFILAFIQNLNPNLILLASTPLSIGGTFVVFLFTAMKHIASNTSIESRSFRIAIAEIMFLVGSPVGLLAAVPILKSFGYKTVFALAALLYLICFIYTMTFVKNDKPTNELIPPDLLSPTSSCKCRPSMTLANVADSFRCCFRKRNGSRRLWLLALLTIFFFRILFVFGDFDMAYLYTHHLFNWQGPQYSVYQTLVGILGIAGLTIMTIVSLKLLPWSDATIGIFSSATSFIGFCIMTLAIRGFMMYIGAVFQMFAKLTTIIVRSLTSKIVAKQEIGKIFSVLAVFESVTPLIASVLFNQVFIHTVETFAGTVYLLCSIFSMICVLLFVFLLISMRGEHLHQEVEGYPAAVEPTTTTNNN